MLEFSSKGLRGNLKVMVILRNSIEWLSKLNLFNLDRRRSLLSANPLTLNFQEIGPFRASLFLFFCTSSSKNPTWITINESDSLQYRIEPS